MYAGWTRTRVIQSLRQKCRAGHRCTACVISFRPLRTYRPPTQPRGGILSPEWGSQTRLSGRFFDKIVPGNGRLTQFIPQLRYTLFSTRDTLHTFSYLLHQSILSSPPQQIPENNPHQVNKIPETPSSVIHVMFPQIPTYRYIAMLFVLK
jgi:hypothetical protein